MEPRISSSIDASRSDSAQAENLCIVKSEDPAEAEPAVACAETDHKASQEEDLADRPVASPSKRAPASKESTAGLKRLRLLMIMAATIICAVTILIVGRTPHLSNEEQAVKLYEKGMANQASGHFADAIQDFQQAVRLNPGLSKAHYSLGLTYLEVDNREGVINQHRILSRLDPNLAAKLYTRLYQ